MWTKIWETISMIVDSYLYYALIHFTFIYACFNNLDGPIAIRVLAGFYSTMLMVYVIIADYGRSENQYDSDDSDD